MKEYDTQLRAKHREFLKEIAPWRHDLYRFCRYLTKNPWDAEDLVQETLCKAYGKAIETHAGIRNLKSYLFRMASNQWVDWQRRGSRGVQWQAEQGASEDLPISSNFDRSFEIRDTVKMLMGTLPEKQLVAFILKEAFDFELSEIADICESSLGSIKSALHRARRNLETQEAKGANKEISVSGISSSATHTLAGSPIPKNAIKLKKSVVDAAVKAFNSRDIETMIALFTPFATGNAPGCFYETSAEEIKNGSLFYTINNPDGTPMRSSMQAKAMEICGDWYFVLFDGNTVDDIWAFELDPEEEKISGFKCYYCCPDALKEIALHIHTDASNHGYYFEERLEKSNN